VLSPPSSRKDISIIPIVVGAISKEVEAQFGAILAPYLASDDTFFVISSDFCHWFVVHYPFLVSV